MKKAIIFLIVITALLSYINAYPQGNPPPANPNSPPTNCFPPNTCVPINLGVGYLIVIGSVLGLIKLYLPFRFKRKKQFLFQFSSLFFFYYQP